MFLQSADLSTFLCERRWVHQHDRQLHLRVHHQTAGIDLHYRIRVFQSFRLRVCATRFHQRLSFLCVSQECYLYLRRKDPDGYCPKGYVRADTSPSTYDLFFSPREQRATLIDTILESHSIRKERDQ